MISRRNIRVKVMQSIYAMHQKGSDNLEKEEKWYFNKNIWITAACFAFISLTVLVTNKNNNETTNDLIRMSSEMDNNSSMVSYNNAESGSIREYSSNESVEEQLESNIKMRIIPVWKVEDKNEYPCNL